VTVRNILSARAARPQAEAWLRGLVRSSVFLASAGGHLGEDELAALASAVAARAGPALGEAHTLQLASVPGLAAQARAARGELQTGDPVAWVDELAASLSGGFRRDVLLHAFRVAAGDGALPPAAELAFRRLGTAFGFTPDEVLALQALARGGAVAVRRGRDTAAIEAVRALWTRGWTEPFEALRAAGVGVQWFDAAAQYQGLGTRLRLDLDASERVLHLHLLGERGPGPHVICLYGGHLTEALGCFERARDTLTALTVPRLLADLGPVSEALFLERDGRLVQVQPP
jgi:hypothetical protein